MEKIAQGKFLIGPVAAPGYTPELGALLAVGSLASFKTDESDSLIQRSSLPFTLAYTSTGAIVANGILSSYWFNDKLRVYGDFWVENMPDSYWGIGYGSASTTPKSDSITAYERFWWWINPRFYYQFKNDYFVGLNVDYNYTKDSDESQGVENDSTYRVYNDKPLNSGLGLIFRYDSRDIPVNARKGMLLNLQAAFYSTAFGGDNNYMVSLIDYRQFKTFYREGITLAWHIKARLASGGDVPYGEMLQFGTPFDLRSYT